MFGIMSINYKFMELDPLELINLVLDNSKLVKGFEIFIRNNEEEFRYLEELVYLCEKYNFHFQVHGNSSLSIEEQKVFLDKITYLSDILGYKINVVLHPKCSGEKNLSIIDTEKYIDDLMNVINLDKIKISLENLNDIDENDRLNKDDVSNIVLNNERLYMTYDIGHEIIENGKITDLNSFVIEKISNVHIHTFNYIYDYGYDHKPIFKNDKNWNLIIKGIEYLKLHKYEGPVVFEYDVYACFGEDLNSKIISYCNSIDYVCERFS